MFVVVEFGVLKRWCFLLCSILVFVRHRVGGFALYLWGGCPIQARHDDEKRSEAGTIVPGNCTCCSTKQEKQENSARTEEALSKIYERLGNGVRVEGGGGQSSQAVDVLRAPIISIA